MAFFPLQPRNVAGFRGTVRYASVNAHKNRVSAEPGLSDGGQSRRRPGPECAAEGEGSVGREVCGRRWELPLQRPRLEGVCP